MEPNNRLLFLKYAAPCATTLVQRKTISLQNYNELVKEISCGKVEQKEPERIFKVAFAVCSAMAQKKSKKIDEKIIRQYFWFGHDAVVDERFELMRDFDPVQCKTYPGVVKSAQSGVAIVKTSLGEKQYRPDFVLGLKEGDFVVVHRDFVVERAGAKKALAIAQKTGKFFE